MPERGIHLEFRVRFAPHALCTDENGKHSVFAYEEYGGLTLNRPNWMYLTVDRLRALQRTQIRGAPAFGAAGRRSSRVFQRRHFVMP